MYLSRRAIEGTYVDTRIFLPSHPPANILVTCKQLRQECLEHHAYMFNVSSPSLSKDAEEKPMSNIVAERLGAEFAEEAERACDDGTLRITVEVQRPLRGPQGYFVPERNELSPRFLALLPLMNKTKKIRFAIWPGYDWWNGGPQPLTDKYGNIRPNTDQAKKPDAVSAAIGKILECLPQVEELSVDVLMQASDGVRWDLPDAKWENVQPWLDTSVTPNAGQTLRKVTRRLIGFCKVSEPEPFYTQHETRQDSGNAWKVERKGDMGTASRNIPHCLQVDPA
ncbi:hypothetical protein EJ02DRAFT_453837 [Clathrospora elynae]|uniref:Uncharacterized protein n=1 Tax=Clathrospora elynae TaxID=706981 RepID=A0A6A5SS54_9PLEO|nr:hypothetical protein EJ02DRAFT_453837 [Clathrospora elynae]